MLNLRITRDCCKRMRMCWLWEPPWLERRWCFRRENVKTPKMAAAYTLPTSLRFSFHLNKLFCVKRSHQNAEYSYNLLHRYKCSSTVADQEDGGGNDKCSKFEKKLRERRRQVQNSVLIHVYSKHVTPKLVNHCQKYGNVVGAYNYSLDADKDFAFIQFQNEGSVRALLTDVRHFDHHAVIPVHSRCLWYHDNQQDKDEVLVAELKENGPPSDAKIIRELQQADSVSHQMTTLHELLTLSDLGQLLRFFICHQIEAAFSGLFTNCVVLPFGSSVNGFGKFDCDLDMVMSLGESSKSGDTGKLFFHTKRSLANNRVQTQRHLETLSDVISNFFPGCSTVQRILQARVPIVKFHHDMVNTDCDLSMNNLSGVYMSELLYLYGEFDSRVRPLVYTILKWAKHSGLTHESPGRWITNFSLILMVVFFLQTRPKPILPSLDHLQSLADESDYRSSEGIECTFLRDLDKFPEMQNQDTLHELLLEFFTFFANFDFKHQGLSIITAKNSKKPDYSPLYIQNPFETDLNVSKNLNSDELGRVKEKMKTALWKLENSLMPNGSSCWGLLELFEAHLEDHRSTKMNRITMTAFFDKDSSSKTDSAKSDEAFPLSDARDPEASGRAGGKVDKPNAKSDLLRNVSVDKLLKRNVSVLKNGSAVREVRKNSRNTTKSVRKKSLPGEVWKF